LSRRATHHFALSVMRFAAQKRILRRNNYFAASP
jgi:hypothetical protein